MKYEISNRDALHRWGEGRDYIIAVKGDPPEGMTFSDGTPVESINVGWRDAHTGETFAIHRRPVQGRSGSLTEREGKE